MHGTAASATHTHTHADTDSTRDCGGMADTLELHAVLKRGTGQELCYVISVRNSRRVTL